MKATIRDPDVLHAIRPFDFIGYLRSHAWYETQRLERGAFWTKVEQHKTYEVLVPLDTQLRDFSNRMTEALSVLEDAEKRSQLEIVEDVLLNSADVIRPRLLGADYTGTISVEQGMVLHEQARDLMLAAACAAIDLRPLHARRKPEQAMEYLNHARFGTPKAGSYIMTIISPVSPRLAGGTDLLGVPLDVEEPFERKTVRMLARGLAAVARASRDVAVSGSIDPMRAAVTEGVSANLCEAIIGLHRGSGEQGVDFSFSWAPSRGIPDDAPTKISILADAIPIIQETARVFRETATIENTEVFGTIQRLEDFSGRQGQVTVFGIADGQQRTVHMQLADEDHTRALVAYESRDAVRCVGKLIREGRSWFLQNPRDFEVLPSRSE